MQIIEIERLSRDYGEGRGIFDISFSIAEGEVFGFLGPNGAGKTTTIRHLLGFLKAKQGSAKILGMDCWKQSDAITRQLGYIPGEINLLNEMSGEEFLRFMARYRNMQDSGRTQELLERFELRPTGISVDIMRSVKWKCRLRKQRKAERPHCLMKNTGMLSALSAWEMFPRNSAAAVM